MEPVMEGPVEPAPECSVPAAPVADPEETEATRELVDRGEGTARYQFPSPKSETNEEKEAPPCNEQTAEKKSRIK